MIKRNKETGSDDEKGEKLLRTHFDDYGKLSWAYSMDIDNFNVLGKNKQLNQIFIQPYTCTSSPVS